MFDAVYGLYDNVGDHSNEYRIVIGAAHTIKLHADVLSNFPCLDIEIIQNLHVVGDKADRSNDDRRVPRVRESLRDVSDVGFEPRIAGPAAPALIGEAPVRTIEASRDQSCGFLQLNLVWRLRGHRTGHTVRAENDRRGLSPLGR